MHLKSENSMNYIVTEELKHLQPYYSFVKRI